MAKEKCHPFKAQYINDVVDQYGLGGVGFCESFIRYPVFWNYLVDRYTFKIVEVCISR